jgi:DNA-binding NarL/FixJ family response regulator
LRFHCQAHEQGENVKKRTIDESPSIAVAIAESDPLRLAGFRALLESQPDLRVMSVSLSEIGGFHEIDVLILGKRHNQNLSAIMQHVKMLRPGIRVLVIAPGTDDQSILDALANGAKGYVDEAAAASEFVKAIRVVNEGLVWASRRIMAMFVERSSRTSKRVIGRADFTHREREVLEMLVDGRSNKEIAKPLGIEERTVKSHVAKLMRKVGVQNRIMLSVHAVNHCLVAAR